ADALNITPALVNVRPGFDTAHNAYTGHTGTYASQFAVTGLTAIHGAAMKLRKELSRLAAWKLQAKEQDLEFGVGGQGPEVRVKGRQDRKSTRLNSSHRTISYAVFCLK